MAKQDDFGTLKILEPASKMRPQKIEALYLSLFVNEAEALKHWHALKSDMEELQHFHAFLGFANTKADRRPLLAIPLQKSIPSYAQSLMLQDACQKIMDLKLSCAVVDLPKEKLKNAQPRLPGKKEISRVSNVKEVYIPRFKEASSQPQKMFGLKTDIEGPASKVDVFNVEPAAGVPSEFEAFDSDKQLMSNEAASAAYAVIQNRYLNAIQQSGEAYNSSGDLDAAKAQLMNLGADALQAAAEQAFYQYFEEYYGGLVDGAPEYDGLRGEFIHAFKQSAFQAVQTVGKQVVTDLASNGNFKSVNLRSQVMDNLSDEFVQGIMQSGMAVANNSQYSFLKHLELEYKIESDSKPSYSALTILPIHRTDNKRHTIFTQLGYGYQSDDVSRSTFTGGLSYRFMPLSEKYLLGTNLFVDYERPYDHLKSSVGVDFQTTYYGLAGNYYKGLSDWRDSKNGFQERALDGYDLELSGRLPVLPALEFFGRAYKWNALEGAKDIDGREARFEYTPVPAFTVEGFANTESGRDDEEFGLALRYNHKFGAPREYMFDWEEQFRVKPVHELVYKKVRRDNAIRVQERVDPNATANTLAPVGPAFVSSVPANAATGLSIGSDLSLTFDQDVFVGVGSIVFTDLTDGSNNFSIPVGDARVSILNNVVSVDLSAQLLDFNSNYEVTLAAGTFNDVNGTAFDGLSSGDLDFTTVVDPTAGFPAATDSVAPNTTTANFEDAQDVGTWEAIINIGAAPDGVIFESGATGQGIAASFGGGNLVFAAGDGASIATGTDSIFGTFPIASIAQGLHHFTFVADPDASAEIGVYIDGIRVITETIAGSMQSGEWAGTNGAGYGLVNSAIRSGVNGAAISGATLISNLDFYTNQQPADF